MPELQPLRAFQVAFGPRGGGTRLWRISGLQSTRMDKPNTVTIVAKAEREIKATRARMHVVIKGQSLFSGRAVLRKAREVRELVAALSAVGIDEGQIEVEEIQASVKAGVITQSSNVAYYLCVAVDSLDLLVDALAAVTGQKDATLTRVEWLYDQTDQTYEGLLREALATAKKRAALICHELNHRNLGIHALRDRTEAGSEILGTLGDSQYSRASRASLTNDDLGLEISHSKTLEVQLLVEFNVAPEEQDV